MRLVEEAAASLADYEAVPIAFEARSRVSLPELRASSGRAIVELPMDPRVKNYDDFPSARPTALATRFDLAEWLVLGAFEGPDRIGALIAAPTMSYDSAVERAGSATIVDMRVAPPMRGHGVGRLLFERAKAWAAGRGFDELRAETQDVNVGACRFYRAMGCVVEDVIETAYGPDMDEAMILWRLAIGG